MKLNLTEERRNPIIVILLILATIIMCCRPLIKTVKPSELNTSTTFINSRLLFIHDTSTNDKISSLAKLTLLHQRQQVLSYANSYGAYNNTQQAASGSSQQQQPMSNHKYSQQVLDTTNNKSTTINCSSAQLLQLFNDVTPSIIDATNRGKILDDQREVNNSTNKRYKRDQRQSNDGDDDDGGGGGQAYSHGRSNDSGYIRLQSDKLLATRREPVAAAANVITKRLAVSSSYNPSSSNLILSSLYPYMDHATSSLLTSLDSNNDDISDYSPHNRVITKSDNEFKGLNIRYNTNSNSNKPVITLGNRKTTAQQTKQPTDNLIQNDRPPNGPIGGKPFEAQNPPPYSLKHFDSTIQTNVSVNIDDTAYLTCKLRMIQDQLKVSWIRNMMILTSGDQRYTSDERFVPKHVEGTYDWILEIKNINMEDKGSYECQINSDPSPASVHFHLDVTAATIRILDEPLKHVPLDDDIKLTCIANFDGPTRGNPMVHNQERPHSHLAKNNRIASSQADNYFSGGQVKTAQYIYWYRDNTSLNFNHPRGGLRVESRDNSTHMISDLTISQAKNSDSGLYTCNLLPEIGSVGPAKINVIVGQMSSASSSSDAGYLYNNSRAPHSRQQQNCETFVLAFLLIIVSYLLGNSIY